MAKPQALKQAGKSSRTLQPRARGKTAGKAQDAREAINMRVKADVRSLIDHAAALAGKNRTDFVLDAARAAAQDTLLDQAHIALDSKSYTAFLALLDAPPKPNAALRKSMLTPAVWE